MYYVVNLRLYCFAWSKNKIFAETHLSCSPAVDLFLDSRKSTLCASHSKRYISAALFIYFIFFYTLMWDCVTKARVISRLHQRWVRLPPRPPLSFQPRCQSRSPRRRLSLFSPYLSARLLFERQPPSVLISGSSSRCPSYFAGWGLREGWRDTVARRTKCRKNRESDLKPTRSQANPQRKWVYFEAAAYVTSSASGGSSSLFPATQTDS